MLLTFLGCGKSSFQPTTTSSDMSWELGPLADQSLPFSVLTACYWGFLTLKGFCILNGVFVLGKANYHQMSRSIVELQRYCVMVKRYPVL